MAVEFTPLNANSINNINTNFQRVDESLQDAVSRSGNGPNHMNADFDLNGNDILNGGIGNFDSVVVNGQPIGSFSGTFKGLWDVGSSYIVNDVVKDDSGNLWIAIQNNTGQSPEEGLYWTLFMPVSDGVIDGDKGDITVSSFGTLWELNDGVVGLDNLAPDVISMFSSGTVDVRLFGADPTGVVDSTNAFIDAATFANTNNLKLSAIGEFLLGTNNDVVINTDAEFVGKIKKPTGSGKLIFGRNKVPVTYNSSHPVSTGITSSADLNAYSSRFSGWASTAEVRDSFVIINTNQDFYTYRNEVKKRVEFNRVYKDGVFESPIRYALTGVGISSVKVIPLEDRRRSVTGLTIDISQNTTSAEFVRIETSLLDIDIRFIQQAAPNPGSLSPYLVRLNECCSVKIRLECQWSLRDAVGGAGGYNLRMDSCYDIDVTARGDGDGWGATGSNLSKRVTFRNSVLSRIDFHEPIFDYLRVRESQVGDWGILATMIGDLDIDTVTFVQRTLANINNSGIIRARPDMAGFCDGDLIVRNIEVVMDSSSADPELLMSTQNAGNPKPAGSPINYRFFKNITIDGVNFRNSNANSQLKISPYYVTGNEPTIGIAKSVTVKRTRGRVVFFGDLRSRISTDPVAPYATELTLDDSEMMNCQIIGNSNNVPILFNANALRALDTFLPMEVTAPGTYTLNGCYLTKMDFFFGDSPQGPIKMTMIGGDLRDDGNTNFFDGASNGNVDLTLINVRIQAASTARLLQSLDALLIRPKFFVGSTPTVLTVSNDLGPSDSGGVWTLLRTPRVGQELIAVFGGGPLSEVPIRIPPVGGIVDIVGRNNAGPVVMGLSRSTQTNLGVGGRARYLQIG